MEQQGNPVADALIRLGLEAQAAGLPHLIIGGNAVIHHGVPRFTRDIDFLIPAMNREAWEALLLRAGYLRYHAAGAFAQYEADPGHPGRVPVDLMMVDESTWEKLHDSAEQEPLASGYFARWPSPPHLIALKLHAWKGIFREGKERDWSDIMGLIESCGIDIHDESFKELVERYGGQDALEKLHGEGSRPSESPS